MAVLEAEVVEEVKVPAIDKSKIELAANLIINHGWLQHAFGDGNRGYCALGAIRVAHGLSANPCLSGHTATPIYPTVKHFATVAGALNCAGETAVMLWNDKPERTKEEVIAALQAAARI